MPVLDLYSIPEELYSHAGKALWVLSLGKARERELEIAHRHVNKLHAYCEEQGMDIQDVIATLLKDVTTNVLLERSTKK